jgi:hypothetical protein
MFLRRMFADWCVVAESVTLASTIVFFLRNGRVVCSWQRLLVYSSIRILQMPPVASYSMLFEWAILATCTCLQLSLETGLSHFCFREQPPCLFAWAREGVGFQRSRSISCDLLLSPIVCARDWSAQSLSTCQRLAVGSPDLARGSMALRTPRRLPLSRSRPGYRRMSHDATTKDANRPRGVRDGYTSTSTQRNASSTRYERIPGESNSEHPVSENERVSTSRSSERKVLQRAKDHGRK